MNEQPQRHTAIVFIHGLASSPAAWDPLIALMKSDSRFPADLSYEVFEYATRLVGNRLLTRIPTYRTVGDKLATRFVRYASMYQKIIFVTHSQGGLVLQTFLSRMLTSGRGEQLAPIGQMVLIACPNGGSGIFLFPRRLVGTFLPNVQEKRLRPLDEEIADTHHHVLRNIAEATSVSPGSYPIPVIALAAESDGVVSRASAYGGFSRYGILPGSHSSVIRPPSTDDPGYLDLSGELLNALNKTAVAAVPMATPRSDISAVTEPHFPIQVPSTPAKMRNQTESSQLLRPLNNLPRQTVAELFGRNEELAELLRTLRDRPGIATLIDGAAGTGKTTLALHVCHLTVRDEPQRFSAVVWLSARTTLLQAEGTVPTSTSASDLGDLTATIAITLDRRDLMRLPANQRAAGVSAALADLRALIVLDNFETVVDPQILAYLLNLPSGCSVIITSRRLIDIDNRIHLRPLDVSQTQQLVRSTLTRRKLVRPDATINTIVGQSGGIPLAVNWLVGRMALGAPHLSHSVQEMDDEDLLKYLFEEGLEQITGDLSILPLLVMTYPPGTLPGTMLDSILLELGMRSSAISDNIARLVTLNLVEYVSESGRYYALPVIKRFLLDQIQSQKALDRTGAPTIRNSYVRALVTFLNRQAEILWQFGYTLNDWDLDRTNTLNSLASMLNQDNSQLTAELVCSFYPYAITFGHFIDFLQITERFLAEAGNINNVSIVNIRARRASILFHSGQVDAADKEFAGADDLFRGIEKPDERLIDLMYFVRSIIAVSRKSPQAEHVLDEAIQFSRRRGVTWARIGFEGWLALYLVSVGRLEEAQALLNNAFDECVTTGDLRSSVFLHVGLARLRLAAGAYDAIIDSSSEVLALASEYGEDHNWAHLHLASSEAFMRKARLAESRHHLERAKELYVRLGLESGIRDCENLLAQMN